MDVIVNNRIHLEVPSSYNDIFDSAFTITPNQMNRIEYHESMINRVVFFTNVQHKEKIKNIEVKKFSNCKNMLDYFKILESEGVDKSIISETIKNMTRFLVNVKADNNKVTCFSEINDSNLMWAHYANHLKGVCLVFDADLDKELFSNLHKIDYTKYRKNDEQNNFNFYFEKSIDWSYEQEWRIVIDTQEEYVSTNACCGIIVGDKAQMTPEDRNVCDLEKNGYVGRLMMKALEKGLSLFRAKADSKEYKINISDDNN